MKKRLYFRLFTWCLVLNLIFSGVICDQAYANSTESAEAKMLDSYDTLEVLFHVPYLDATGIKINFQSERQKLIKKIPEALKKEPVHAYLDVGLFSSHFAITRDEESEYLYYGATKDNRPDGFGVLATGQASMNDGGSPCNLVYAGNFSKGMYNGYGVKFHGKSFDFAFSALQLSGVVEEGIIPEDVAGSICVYYAAHVTEEGTWKKSRLSGKANIFAVSLSNSPQDGYWGGSCYPSIVVGEAKNGNLTGKSKWYTEGVILYDGKIKNSNFDGEGTLYFPNGSILYKGKWKNGQYHGQGTLYDESGKVIYKGKWENGDYAS